MSPRWLTVAAVVMAVGTAPSASADTAACGTGEPFGRATLTDLRTGRHDGFDRIVLAFDGPAPICTARYVDQVFADGSGDPIALAGNAFLRVALQGASTYDDDGHRGFTGVGDTDTAALSNVEDVAMAGDFEAVLSIGIGLARRTDFEVFSLSDPTRVVIDIAHQA